MLHGGLTLQGGMEAAGNIDRHPPGQSLDFAVESLGFFRSQSRKHFLKTLIGARLHKGGPLFFGGAQGGEPSLWSKEVRGERRGRNAFFVEGFGFSDEGLFVRFDTVCAHGNLTHRKRTSTRRSTSR